MKNIAGFLLTLTLAVLYTLFINANSGVVFISVILTASVVSVLMTLRIKSRLELSVSTSSTLLNKNDTTVFSAVFKKNSIIPAPFIQLKLFSSEHFSKPEFDTYKISLSSKAPEKIEAAFSAVVRGNGTIGISELVITDYLGLVAFNFFKNGGQGKYSKSIEIFPDIPDTPQDNQLLREMCDAVAYDDNEEAQAVAAFSGGVPGYEHREYTPGDSIKKINWKLSTKRDNLLVRLDEKPKITALNLLLDFSREYSESDAFARLKSEERIIEAMLALLTLIVGLELECNVFFFSGNKWSVKKIQGPSDIQELRYLMAGYEFSDKSAGERIPADFIEESSNLSSLIIFSSAPDKAIVESAAVISSKGGFVQTTVSESSGYKPNGAWLVSSSYEFKKS